MITSKEWNTIMTFTGYGNIERAASTYTNTNGPDLSGSAYKGTTDTYDLTKNIYDLAGNVTEWTLTESANYASNRVNRGGDYNYGSHSASYGNGFLPVSSGSDLGSRLALYIRYH